MTSKEIIAQIKPPKTQRKSKNLKTRAPASLSSKTKKQRAGKAIKKRIPGPKFKCSHCSITFEKAVSLGGHVSKAHPGMQSNYTHKMEIYRARTEHRENLVKAKEWFVDITGLNPKDHRVSITEIKKQFMRGDTPDQDKIKQKLKLNL